jgi:esterase/lipase superfamily enzyme
MAIEYHKWWSPHLNQDMELKIYGQAGKPMLVFPAQGGRFFEFEDFGMTEACKDLIEQGSIRVFTVDSIDNQSWANGSVHPAERARRHEDYDRYITREVAPLMRQLCGEEAMVISTGVSMGGYHAGNFFFRHPDIFDTLICLSGLFQVRMFVGEYMDDNVYFNSPLLFLPGMEDKGTLERYRRSRIIICTGQGAWEEAMMADAHAMQDILSRKNIPAWVDYWGYDVNHDWPWWRRQLPYFLGHVLQPDPMQGQPTLSP